MFVDRIVTAISSCAAFSKDREQPFDLEDALLLWVNKVCGLVNGYVADSFGPEW